MTPAHHEVTFPGLPGVIFSTFGPTRIRDVLNRAIARAYKHGYTPTLSDEMHASIKRIRRKYGAGIPRVLGEQERWKLSG